MTTETIVVTGANRGIGLSFCRHYQARGARVMAVCRHASEELSVLGVEVIAGVDISQAGDVEKLRQALQGVQVDVLINNAGILRNEILGQLNFDTIEEQFQVNTLGPLRVTEALLENMADGSKIALISSRMGSIADNTSGGRYGYRMSKCALNIAGVSLAHDLTPHGIAVGIFHPGLVGTEMIGGHGDITPDTAAERLIERIEALTMHNSGTFWHSNGEILPW